MRAIGLHAVAGSPRRDAGRRSWRHQHLRRFFPSDVVTPGPIELTHRRIFILPNRRGFGLALLLTVQFLVAINYGNSLTFILTFLLVGIAAVSAVHAFRNLAGLRVRTGRSAPVFAGESGLFEVHIDNPSRRARHGLRACLRGTAEGVDFEIPPESSVTLQFRTPTCIRGWLPMTTVTVSTVYPLGLLRAWSPLNLDQRLLVYPRPSAEFFARPPLLGAADAARSAAAGDDDFFGFTGYRPGDPLRRIHWKGIAKGQAVQVKQYVAGEGAAADLDWLETPGADTEQRLAVLCRWVLEAERAGTPFSLRLPGTTIATGGGEAHRHRCLEALALFGQ